ncbi:MAG TPA: DUF5131 family protein [Planctomycetota bacterium]|nr:DUF5131 family protein [Planctomycetota bacterium]
MAYKSSIEWTGATWSPVRGCSPTSPGCLNCYAARMCARGLPNLRFPDGESAARMTPTGPCWTGRVELVESQLLIPLHWRNPRRIFVNSMSDTHHESLPDSAIDRMYAVMALCPQHTFMVPTKRAKRRREWCKGRYRKNAVLGIAWDMLGHLPKYKHHDINSRSWPLPNVWEGVSVSNQEEADRDIGILLQTPAALRFVSYEPALGPVQLTRHHQWCPEHDYEGGFCCSPCPSLRSINWLIAGGESGPGARPCNIAWLRSAIGQCKDAGVPCFMKQLGSIPLIPEIPEGLHGHDLVVAARAIDLEWPLGTHFGNRTGDPRWNGRQALLRDPKGGDMAEWPEDLRVREQPKRAAGHPLDGKDYWNEMPEVQA